MTVRPKAKLSRIGEDGEKERRVGSASSEGSRQGCCRLQTIGTFGT